METKIEESIQITLDEKEICNTGYENNAPEVKKIFFKNSKFRYVVIDNEKWVVARDVCPILGLTEYYIKKVPHECLKIIKIKTDSGASFKGCTIFNKIAKR